MVEATARGPAMEAPNIIVVVFDQERDWDTLPPPFAEGSEWFRQNLPGRDEMRRSATRFARHYINSVPCTPSRACIYTGQFAPRTGVHRNFNNLPPRYPTLGSLLRDIGYATAYKGKWHLTASLLTKDDVDEEQPAAQPTLDGPALTADDPRRYQAYLSALQDFGFDVWQTSGDSAGSREEGFAVDPRTAAQAVQYLADADESRPFLLAVNFINPHDVMHYRSGDAPPSPVDPSCIACCCAVFAVAR